MGTLKTLLDALIWHYPVVFFNEVILAQVVKLLLAQFLLVVFIIYSFSTQVFKLLLAQFFPAVFIIYHSRPCSLSNNYVYAWHLLMEI